MANVYIQILKSLSDYKAKSDHNFLSSAVRRIALHEFLTLLPNNSLSDVAATLGTRILLPTAVDLVPRKVRPSGRLY